MRQCKIMIMLLSLTLFTYALEIDGPQDKQIKTSVLEESKRTVERKERIVHGILTSIDTSKQMIVIRDTSGEYPLYIKSNVKISSDKKVIVTDSLLVGDSVTLKYLEFADTSKIAEHIIRKNFPTLSLVSRIDTLDPGVKRQTDNSTGVTPNEEKKLREKMGVLKILGGRLTAVDNVKKTLTVHVKSNNYPVSVDSETTLTADQKAINFIDFKVHDRVTLHYWKFSDGSRLANDINNNTLSNKLKGLMADYQNSVPPIAKKDLASDTKQKDKTADKKR